jgi:hypothetical protein
LEYPTELTGQEIAGIYIHEPGALVSNFAIAVTCLIIAYRHRDTDSKSARFWALFVICLGIAAAGGVISHGFPIHISPSQFFGIWWLKNTFVLLANLFATLAVFSLTKFSERRLLLILGFKFVLLSALLFITFDFLPAVVDLALTYFAILAITWSRTETKGVKYLKLSFLIALVSGFFYLFPFSLFNDWFTNKDAVHVFAIISLILVSKAIHQMESF